MVRNCDGRSPSLLCSGKEPQRWIMEGLYRVLRVSVVRTPVAENQMEKQMDNDVETKGSKFIDFIGMCTVVSLGIMFDAYDSWTPRSH